MVRPCAEQLQSAHSGCQVELGSVTTWKPFFLLVLKNENCVPADSALLEQTPAKRGSVLGALRFSTAPRSGVCPWEGCSVPPAPRDLVPLRRPCSRYLGCAQACSGPGPTALEPGVGFNHLHPILGRRRSPQCRDQAAAARGGGGGGGAGDPGAGRTVSDHSLQLSPAPPPTASNDTSTNTQQSVSRKISE